MHGPQAAREPAGFLWLEITRECPLQCTHCYAESGPRMGHGTMAFTDWIRVMREAVALGVTEVQFIGGEPTSHPRFVELVGHALGLGLAVEVYTNLVRVTEEHWELYAAPGVQLATSYYSDDPVEHAAITKGANSHRLTTANIAEAVRRGISLRAGVIGVQEGQRTAEAIELLRGLGVASITYDALRQVGRGVRELEPDTSQLCGWCGAGRLAISPEGTVWPCIFSRWLGLGNVLEQPLAQIVSGGVAATTLTRLRAEFEARELNRFVAQPAVPTKAGGPSAPCAPSNCSPCPPNCAPAMGCTPDRVARPPWRSDAHDRARAGSSSPEAPEDPTEARGCTPGNGCSPAEGCNPTCIPSGPPPCRFGVGSSEADEPVRR